MSESDSGVDTGGESNESNCMSVESLPRVDEEKDLNDVSLRLQMPSVSQQVNSAFVSAQPTYWSYTFTDYRQHRYVRKVKPGFLHKRSIQKWKLGINIEPYNAVAERKLRKAVASNAFEQVQNLLNGGVDPCSADEKLRSPLHFASCHGFTDIARLLIERGADVNQKDALGNTPLHLAVCTTHIDMVTLLLQAGTDINIFNDSGRSPLHLAESKLRLMQMRRNQPMKLKRDVRAILHLIKTFLERTGQAVDLDLLNIFSNRLCLHQTVEEINSDVSDLLSSLSHLNLQKL